jgi:hypothetical protein
MFYGDMRRWIRIDKEDKTSSLLATWNEKGDEVKFSEIKRRSNICGNARAFS